jgi:hypothetical protein
VITGITRVRNESLILADTLRHYLGVCDRIFVYDDDSTDATPEVAASFDRVTLIRGDAWRTDRTAEETRHRALLLDRVQTEWVLCFDADERLEGPLPDLSADGYRFQLFDGYMTPECSEPYTGGPLAELPRMWGPERRDILMLFRKSKSVYRGRDKREPNTDGRIALAQTRVRHYGKCLSVEHWEETCDYYAQHFPEPYRSKWRARKGKAIHTLSDFGAPLKAWGEL